MQDNNKLIELIEQMACGVNMLSPKDLSELDGLQTILNEINQNIATINDGPVQLLEQARGTGSELTELLQKILQKEVKYTNKSIKSVTQVVSTLQNLVEQITESQPEDGSIPSEEDSSQSDETTPQEISIPEEDVPLILDFITESSEHIESAEAGLLELETKPDDKDVLNQIFRSFHTIKGMAGFLNLTEIGSLAHSAENLLDLARKDELVLADENCDIVFESIDMIKKMIVALKEAVETDKPITAQKHLTQLLAKLKASAEGQNLAIVLDTPEGQKKDQELDDILTDQDENKSKDDFSPAKTKAKTLSGDEKIKVSTVRLDDLLNMVGELVIAQLMVAEEANTNLASEHSLNRKVGHQGKITRELQELSMSMRMVPIAGVFQKMARLVRDLSHKAGKKINFITSGEETELDRSIVDKIADPLVHMVRNSIDHGIESPQERTNKGKNPTGIIKLRAFHQAGNIVVEIEDDGKGLDKNRILEKAIDNGIVKANQVLSDEEIFKLIFHAGLSTAQKVTSVSGRGVGMDVVKKNIESLRGKVDIHSTTDMGTTFTIRMPLTLAIIDGQIVKIGSDRYIIPINSIVQTLRPEANQISSIQNRAEMAMVHDQLLPLVRLYKLFSVVPTTEDPTKSLLVTVEEDNKKCCFLVDELLGQQQIVIKSLSKGLGKLKGISGGAIMGDGRVSLILDVPGLMELAQS
ncbi:MAG: chemotaxis protein CheA [Planctomycetes bacterium]|nr:chemotaxis protein CheA [Planctomycetota bacterium]